MKNIALAVLLVPTFAAAQKAPLASEADRARPAKITASASSSAITAAKAVLANGLGLSLIESHRLPLVAVTLVIPQAGSDADPIGREGLSYFVAAMAQEGVPGLPSAAALSDAIDDIGASLAIAVGDDKSTVTAFVLKENLGRAFELMGKMVREPAHLSGAAEYSAALERLRRQQLSDLQMEKGDPTALAQKRLASAVFGAAPRGRFMTERSLNAITPADVAARHRASMVPNGAVLSVAGDVSLEELKTLSGENFGTWKPAALPAVAAPAGIPVKPTEAGLVIELVDLPGEQAEMRLGVKTAPRLAAEYDALSLAVGVLGGPTIGRLDQNLRETRHWAYGARASMSAWKDGGMTAISTKVQADKTGDSLREILAEVERLRSTPVPADELAAAKTSMKGLYLQSNRTVQSLAARQAMIQTMGLPASTLNDYEQRIDALTADKIQAAAKAWLTQKGLKIVIVGPAKQLAPQLRPYGTVRIFDADGKPRA